MMDVAALAQLVAKMRKAQREYFRTKSLGALNESKSLEKRVDTALREVLESRPLFDREG